MVDCKVTHFAEKSWEVVAVIADSISKQVQSSGTDSYKLYSTHFYSTDDGHIPTELLDLT